MRPLTGPGSLPRPRSGAGLPGPHRPRRAEAGSLAAHHAAALLEVGDAVDRDRDLLAPAARPAHLELVDARGIAQADVHALRALAGIAVAAVDLADQRRAADLRRDPGADRIAVRAGADQLQLDPVP